MNTRAREKTLSDSLYDFNIYKVFGEIDYSKFNQICSFDIRKVKPTELLNDMVVE